MSSPDLEKNSDLPQNDGYLIDEKWTKTNDNILDASMISLSLDNVTCNDNLVV